MPITIVVLAGGQSRRMGQDKAGIVVGGEALLIRTVLVARQACPRVSVVGRDAPSDWPLPEVAFRPDGVPGQGPLGGLTTGLEMAGGDAVLLLACDMPLLTASALAWLIQAKADTPPLADGLVAVNGTQREPLFSIYNPACMPLAQRQLSAGRRSLQALIGAGDFAFVDAPPDVRKALQDVDTPADLAAVQSAVRIP